MNKMNKAKCTNIKLRNPYSERLMDYSEKVIAGQSYCPCTRVYDGACECKACEIIITPK